MHTAERNNKMYRFELLYKNPYKIMLKMGSKIISSNIYLGLVLISNFPEIGRPAHLQQSRSQMLYFGSSVRHIFHMHKFDVPSHISYFLSILWVRSIVVIFRCLFWGDNNSWHCTT